MEKKLICLALVLILNQSYANVNQPFQYGFSMGNLGTIMPENEVAGFQPWIPAAFCKCNRRFGLACGAVSYYDKMDNLREKYIYNAFGGTYLAHKRFNLKLAISHFSALDMYFEQSGFTSLGFSLIKQIRISVEITGTRIGLRCLDRNKQSTVDCGVSAFVPFRFTALALRVNHLTVKSGYVKGVNPKICIETGIHTVQNRFGAQGVLIETTPSSKQPIRFILGEQYRFFKCFAVEASIANNPFMIGLGVLLEIADVKSSVSLVNHPVLGWSKGFAVMY